MRVLPLTNHMSALTLISLKPPSLVTVAASTFVSFNFSSMTLDTKFIHITCMNLKLILIEFWVYILKLETILSFSFIKILEGHHVFKRDSTLEKQ